MKRLLLLLLFCQSVVLPATDGLEALLYMRRTTPKTWQSMYTGGRIATGITGGVSLAGIAGLLVAHYGNGDPAQTKALATWSKWAIGVGIPLTVLSGILAKVTYHGGRYHRLNAHIMANKPITNHIAKEIHHFFTHGYLYPRPEWGEYVIKHRDHKKFNRVERSLKQFAVTKKDGDVLNVTINDVAPQPLTMKHYQELIEQYAANEYKLARSNGIDKDRALWHDRRVKHQNSGSGLWDKIKMIINGEKRELHPKRVHNTSDEFCAAHSMATGLTGQRFHGPELAYWLAHYSPDCRHHIARALAKNGRMPLGLYHMIPYVTGRPLCLWRHLNQSWDFKNGGYNFNQLYVVLGGADGGVQYDINTAVHIMTDFNHVEYLDIVGRDNAVINKQILEDRIGMWRQGALKDMGALLYHAASADMYMILMLYLYARAARDYQQKENQDCYELIPANDPIHTLIQEILTHLKQQLSTVQSARHLLLYHRGIDVKSEDISQWLMLTQRSQNHQVRALGEECLNKCFELSLKADAKELGERVSMFSPLVFAQEKF